jgi:hypothetical protein
MRRWYAFNLSPRRGTYDSEERIQLRAALLRAFLGNVNVVLLSLSEATSTPHR